MVDHPGEVLPHLVDLAIEICGGISGGISLFEKEPAPGLFRWHHLRGDLKRFTGGTTPRYFSPCGVTLDQSRPVLCERPERMYGWLADAGISLAECLLVPLYVGGTEPQGTLWLVSANEGHFDSGHARVMTELAAFAGIALRMLGTEERLNLALDRQQMLTDEMSHRIKNLFAITRGMIGISARDASTPAEVFNSFTGRLDALAVAHDLVRPLFDKEGVSVRSADLADLVRTILRPHETGANQPGQVRIVIEGLPIPLGEHATNGLALLFYELATNAAKYGALIDEGSVDVTWRNADGRLILNWSERGGPVIKGAPMRTGFGTKLVQNTIVGQLGGTLLYDWQPEGMAATMSVPIESLAN